MIPKPIARILLSAILSDTLSLGYFFNPQPGLEICCDLDETSWVVLNLKRSTLCEYRFGQLD